MSKKRCTGPCGLAKPTDAFYTGRAQCKDCYCDLVNERRTKRLGHRLEHGPNLVAFERYPDFIADDETPNGTDVSSVDSMPAAPIDHKRIARDRRRASDFDALKPEDFSGEFDTSVANVDETPTQKAERSRAASEKRQEFNAKMGEFAQDMRDASENAHAIGSVAGGLSPRHAEYIVALAEQERRFGNRRWARSIAIAEAHEQLAREQMVYIAERYFRDKVEATGYARIAEVRSPKRSVCVLLSDIHLGSELDSLDEPVSYKAVEEARRLEYVLRQVLDYKPQYRSDSEAVIILNGDLIEGQLMHDFRAGSPLAEQKTIFWRYFTAFIAHVSAQYPSVRVVCQSGNHGRDKVRHPGRATARKWDGHEHELYQALREMCSGLLNVKWQIDFRAVSVLDLHGSYVGVTHGDTEVKLGDPDTKSTDNARILDRINSIGLYKHSSGEPVYFDGWTFGHYHKARYQPRAPRVLWNAALVPPNGYARSAGYIGEPQGQWLWEAVEGHPIGDVRFVEVGLSQDRDERLGTIIKPFRFTSDQG